MHARFLEYVADTLAERLSSYREGLDANTLARFDEDASRLRYLAMQEILCNLSLVGRRQLGTAMLDTFGPPGGPPRWLHRAGYLDEDPTHVFVLVASHGESRQTIFHRLTVLLRSALAHYGRRNALGDDVRRQLGGERATLEYYLLHDASFAAWTSYDDAAASAEADRIQRTPQFTAKHQRDIPACIRLEKVISEMIDTQVLPELGRGRMVFRRRLEVLHTPR